VWPMFVSPVFANQQLASRDTQLLGSVVAPTVCVQTTAAGAGQPQDRSAEPLIRMGDSCCGRHYDPSRSCRYCDRHNVPGAPMRIPSSGTPRPLYPPMRLFAWTQLRPRLPSPQLKLPHPRHPQACISLLVRASIGALMRSVGSLQKVAADRARAGNIGEGRLAMASDTFSCSPKTHCRTRSSRRRNRIGVDNGAPCGSSMPLGEKNMDAASSTAPTAHREAKTPRSAVMCRSLRGHRRKERY